MKILVTGAEGQLGRCIRDASVTSTDDYIFTDVADLDICDADSVERMFIANSIDVVINCAAYTDVERAETQEDVVLKINAQAVGILARTAKAFNATLIHISTDYVFDGSANLPLKESATPNPVSAYGRTKLAGENAILESGCSYLIFRTSWLYSEYGRNFVKTIYQRSVEKPSLQVVTDQIGSPTYARDLAEFIVTILEKRMVQEHYGLYHFANLGVCSWYDLAKMTAEIAGHNECSVKPCSTSDWPSAVNRPAYSVLDKSKTMSTFSLDIPYWIDSLRTCVQRLKTICND